MNAGRYLRKFSGAEFLSLYSCVSELPDSHSDIPPADFEVKNIIECAREFGNTDLYIFDPRKATLAHWWADMAEDQKRWTKTPASKRKDFPTPKIGKDWKAIRCSTGAYLIPPTGKKLAEINLDLERKLFSAAIFLSYLFPYNFISRSHNSPEDAHQRGGPTVPA